MTGTTDPVIRLPLSYFPEVERAISQGASALQDGLLIAFPTDTFYALGADARNETAVERLRAAKGRREDHPLPVLIADASDLSHVVKDAPDQARKVISEYWPGPLTIVLRAAPIICRSVMAGGDTVGVRVPDHEPARDLIRRSGGPVTGTSANRTGTPPARTAAEVAAQLGDAVDYVMPGDCGDYELPSTVVDFTGDTPRILRAGPISKAEIEELIGTLIGPITQQ